MTDWDKVFPYSGSNFREINNTCFVFVSMATQYVLYQDSVDQLRGRVSELESPRRP